METIAETLAAQYPGTTEFVVFRKEDWQTVRDLVFNSGAEVPTGIMCTDLVLEMSEDEV